MGDCVHLCGVLFVGSHKGVLCGGCCVFFLTTNRLCPCPLPWKEKARQKKNYIKKTTQKLQENKNHKKQTNKQKNAFFFFWCGVDVDFNLVLMMWHRYDGLNSLHLSLVSFCILVYQVFKSCKHPKDTPLTLHCPPTKILQLATGGRHHS